MYISTVYTCRIHSVACNWMSCATCLMQLHKFAVTCVTCNWILVANNSYPKILIVCALPCWAYFFHTKSMMLKGDFFGFWISIYWNFEARPMFETMLWVDYTRKNNKFILMSKTLYLQYVELHVNWHIQY
jgi:hypothetical protein